MQNICTDQQFIEFFSKLQIKLDVFGAIQRDHSTLRSIKLSPLNIERWNVDDRYTLFPISAKGSIMCSRVSTFY